MTTIAQLNERFYGNHVNERARFDRAVRRHLLPDHFVLDAGAGRGRKPAHAYKETPGS